MSDRPLLEPLERFENGDPMDNIWERRCLAAEVRGVLARARLAEEMYEELCELREQDGKLFDQRLKALAAENERLRERVLLLEADIDQQVLVNYPDHFAPDC